MLRYAAGPLAIAMIFALGLALVGLGVDIRLVDQEAPAQALRLEGPERLEATAGGAAAEGRLRLVAGSAAPLPDLRLQTPPGVSAEADASACPPSLPRGGACEIGIRIRAEREGTFLVRATAGPARHEIAIAVEAPGGLVLEAEDLGALDLRRGIRPSPWIPARLRNGGAAPVETEGRLILSGPGAEAFQIATDDGAPPCPGTLAPGAACAFRIRSVFQGPGIAEAALLVEAANRPVLPLRSDSPEAPAMLEIADPRARPGQADLEEALSPWSARSGARRVFEVRNLGRAPSADLRGRILLRGDAPLALVENACLGPLPPGGACRIAAEARPVSPGPFAGEIVVLPANPDAPFGDLRTEGAARAVRGVAEGLPVALTAADGSPAARIAVAGRESVFRLENRGRAGVGPVRPEGEGLAVSHDCPQALAPGQSCRIAATPARPGAYRLRLGPGLPAWDLRAPL